MPVEWFATVTVEIAAAAAVTVVDCLVDRVGVLVGVHDFWDLYNHMFSMTEMKCKIKNSY